jgi:hypothetical protein
MGNRYIEFLSGKAESLPTVAVSGVDVRRFASYGEETWLATADDDWIGLLHVSDEAHARRTMAALLHVARGEPGGDLEQ